MNGLAKNYLIYIKRDHIASGVSAGTGVCNLVEQLENRTAMYIARKIGGVRSHQYRHRQLVCLHIHQEWSDQNLIWNDSESARVDLMLSLELAISTNDGQVNELKTRVAAVGVSHLEPANIKLAQGFKSGD